MNDLVEKSAVVMYKLECRSHTPKNNIQMTQSEMLQFRSVPTVTNIVFYNVLTVNEHVKASYKFCVCEKTFRARRAWTNFESC